MVTHDIFKIHNTSRDKSHHSLKEDNRNRISYGFHFDNLVEYWNTTFPIIFKAMFNSSMLASGSVLTPVTILQRAESELNGHMDSSRSTTYFMCAVLDKASTRHPVRDV